MTTKLTIPIPTGTVLYRSFWQHMAAGHDVADAIRLAKIDADDATAAPKTSKTSPD